jgi:transcriptional regulator with XRE-family HTH domain
MKFEFEKFYQAVNAKRTARSASWRQVAREIGVGKSTLARMAQNKRPDADGLAALAYWAGLNPADFVCLDSPAPVASRNADDCLQFVNGAVPA